MTIQETKAQIEQEAAALALKLYNLQQSKKAIKARLKELTIASNVLVTATSEDNTE